MSVSSELAAIAKFVFPSGVPHAFVQLNTLFGDCKKNEDVTGQDYRFTVAQSQGAVGSADYNTAYSVAGNVQYTRFIVTPVTDYALARMNGEDWERLSSDEGAVIDAWKDRIDSAVYEARRSLAIQMFRDGSGARGQIASGASVGSPTIPLSDASIGSSEIHNFYTGMQVQASATAAGALRASGAAATITAVDRAAGTISTSANWSTLISGISPLDYLHRRGDAANNATSKVITGLEAWLVGGSTPGTLFSANRDVDPVALAGTALDGTGIPMEEAVLELASRVSMEAEGKKVFYCHPRDKVQVVKLLEGKSRLFRPTQGPEGRIGYEEIVFETDNGPMVLKGDVNCPRRKGYIVVPDLVELNSVGKAPKILQKDGQTVRARDAFDSYEMRVGTYGLFCVRFPGAMGRIYNWGL